MRASAQDFRNFRLDRIGAIKETAAMFRPRQGQLFKVYLARL